MKRTDNFHKFVKQPKGSAIKEQIKQEKKKAKKERAEAIEKHFAKKREERSLQRESQNANRPPANKSTRHKDEAPKKTYSKRAAPTKNFKSNKAPFRPKEEEVVKKTAAFKQAGATKTFNKSSAPAKTFKTNRSKERDQDSTEKSFTPAKSFNKPTAPAKTFKTDRFSKEKDQESNEKSFAPAKSFNKPAASTKRSEPHTKPLGRREMQDTKAPANHKAPTKNTKASKSEKTVSKLAEVAKDLMPLNKYIAHSGICSRRDAAILVKEEKVTVNGKVVTDPGTKVSVNDTINVSNQKVTPSKNFVYILLNKPKDYITTLEDPQGRRTVLDLVRQATSERIYPIGRLDRNTSGVLLLTNDGELAQKLSHPKHEIKKVYEVKLDRNLTKGDMDQIAEGITLEDGFIAPDVIAYADSKDKSIIGIEIHSGRNRIVRRIFEHMKYDVRGLDRVMYAGLTKKNVQRGNWRFLSEKEVRILKFMNQSYIKGKAE